MKALVKRVLKNTKIYFKIQTWINHKKQIKELRNYKPGKDRPLPHIMKQNILKDYAEKYNLKILIETGTYYGDMVEAMRKIFITIYSVELSRSLFNRAVKRFKSYKHINLICGDSSMEINNILKNFFDKRNLILVDFKLEFGKHKDKILLGDEISPDTCRVWDKATKEKLDKDRFRRDLGKVEEATKAVSISGSA